MAFRLGERLIIHRGTTGRPTTPWCGVDHGLPERGCSFDADDGLYGLTPWQGESNLHWRTRANDLVYGDV